jgi:hypothetical protein
MGEISRLRLATNWHRDKVADLPIGVSRVRERRLIYMEPMKTAT